MGEGPTATGTAATRTTDRRRRVAAGVLAAAVVAQLAANAQGLLEVARGSALVTAEFGALSLTGVTVDLLAWVLPSVVALVGLARARVWGPAAAVANGLVVLLPAALSLTWVSGPFDAPVVGTLVAHLLLVASAGVAATLVPWSAVTPTPARLLLWAGAGAVVAARILPVSVEGRGVESLAASVLRFGGTSLQLWTLLAGVLTLLAIAVIADRLPTEQGVGAAAVLAIAGLGVLSPILSTWLMSQPLSPLAALGPLGAVTLVWWLREVRAEPEPLDDEPAER